jgi:large subunit ribosomal protein L1
MKHSNRYIEARQKIDATVRYGVTDAVTLVKGNAIAKFDETIEFIVNLGIDPRRADQQVRGTVVLPNGTGKTMRVLVITQGEPVKEAEEAGADFVGGDDMVAKIQGGWLDFDVAITTPDMMRSVGKLGKVLGPRGLMPNPKTGTVTKEVGKAVKEFKAGKIEYRTDKTGIVQTPVGKASFELDKLIDNVRAMIDTIVRARPSGAKGTYIKNMYLSSTMGPSVQLDTRTAVLDKGE